MLAGPVVEGSVAAEPGTARPGTARPVPVPAGGAVVAAGLGGPDGVGEAPARPALDGGPVDDMPAGGEATGGRGRGGVAAGRVPEPRPGGGMSRTLPVLGNSYGFVLATVG